MTKPFAFLSSPGQGLKQLREEIKALPLPGGRTIWVDEIDDWQADKRLPFVTIAGCFQRIRESEILLVLLSGSRYGSPVEVGSQKAHVSYWETELFYASLLGKKVQVFLVDDFSPDPKLASLLSLLHQHLPRERWSGPHTRNRVVAAVHDFLLAEIGRGTRVRGARRLLSGLIDGLFHLRGRDGVGGTGERESLQFLDGILLDPTVETNPVVISSLFQEVESLSDEEERLTRLWLILRELSGVPFDSEKHAGYLPQWNKLFGEWALAGSWYGLHGHVNMAVLPALLEQARIRARMRKLGSSEWQDQPVTYPGGALASSRYSISGKAGRRRTKRFLLEAALNDLERSLSERTEDSSNLIAIRGSVYRRLGAFSAAVNDYEAVLEQRRIGGTDSQVGEALSELGYGYLFKLRFWRGRSLLEEGVHILTDHASRQGFLIRAKRKLSIAYALTGHPLRARDELHEATQLAREQNVKDQIRAPGKSV